MKLWAIHRHIQRRPLDKQMKANTVATAAVLWRPDKTMQQVLKKTARFVFPLFLCFCLLPLFCVYLVMTLFPVFHPVNVSTVQSGPNLTAALRPFVLGKATGEQLLNVVHMVPGGLS